MKKPIDSYLKPDPKIEKKSVRAPNDLWLRVEKLADKKGDTSVNAIVVAALEKACDEEGV